MTLRDDPLLLVGHRGSRAATEQQVRLEEIENLAADFL
jgi:hypothetical protein